MASITVRNLPDEVHRALRVRAAQNGRSTEAEVRAILEAVTRPVARKQIGTMLADFGDKYQLEIKVERDSSPAEGVSFEC